MATRNELTKALLVLQTAEHTLREARESIPENEVKAAKNTLGQYFTSLFKKLVAKGVEDWNSALKTEEKYFKELKDDAGRHVIGKLPAAWRQYKSDCKRAIVKANQFNKVTEAKKLSGISQIKRFSLTQFGDGDSQAAMTRLAEARSAALKPYKARTSERQIMDERVAAIIDKATAELNKLLDTSKPSGNGVVTKRKAGKAVAVKATKKKVARKRATRRAA